jgi:hypothetical protein
MGNDFQIELIPNGKRLSMVLKSTVLKTPNAGESFARPVFKLSEDEITRLRFGDASEQLVTEVREKLSKWFLKTDINGQIQNAIRLSRGGEPLRVIFAIADKKTRYSLKDIPFELITLKDDIEALVVNADVAAFLHLLPNANKSTASPSSSTWPLKILIVRSNPNRLGGAVPPAATILESILSLWKEDPPLAPSLLRIDILSSEEPDEVKVAARPTIDNFEMQLMKVNYDILIYIGHGDIQSTGPGKEESGVLQFENENNTGPAVLNANRLASILRQHPVPVVLLMGCLTAVDAIPDDMRDGVSTLMPKWISGNQGVAQALIDSESGVQIAIGMQYQISTRNAKRFLEFFFRSLLKNKDEKRRGNVEEASRFARNSLKFQDYMWSAPVVFSTLSPEPILPFLAGPPDCEVFEMIQRFRIDIWNSLSKLSWRLRGNVELQEMASDRHETLKKLDQEIAQSTLNRNSSLITPAFIESRPGDEIKMPINLAGTLKQVATIDGKLIVVGENAKITRIEPSEALIASNFQVLPTNDDKTEFLIRHKDGGADITAGQLFSITMTAESTGKTIISVSLGEIKIVPPQPVCPGNNAAVIPVL